MNRRFEYGLRAHDHGRNRPAPLAARLAAAGATHAQLAPSKALEGVEPLPGSFSENLAIETARAFGDSGIRVSVLGCYVDLLAADPEARKLASARFTESLRLAPWLGAGIVGTESFGGPSAAGQPGTDGLDPFLAALEALALCAAGFGVDFAIEPVASQLVSTPRRMDYLLGHLGSERLFVILDPVNLVDPQAQERGLETALECVELFGPRIRAVHVKDYLPGQGGLAVVPPGRGVFPFGEFFARSYALGLRCDLVLENCPPEAVAAAVLFLEEAGAELVTAPGKRPA